MKFQIITLFPEMFEGVFDHSMIFKAQEIKAVEIELIYLRDFGLGPRKQVDDIPYGGGDGMVLKPEPMFAAIEQAKKTDPEALVVMLTPRGIGYKQSVAKKFAAGGKGLILLCGRYEGFDERIASLADIELSVGNYVLTGGEIPAMAVVDSVTRLLPGVLGGDNSVDIESFQDDDQTVEFPQYTRPEDFNGMVVPEVLLSGHHGEIEKWRQQQSKNKTEEIKSSD